MPSSDLTFVLLITQLIKVGVWCKDTMPEQEQSVRDVRKGGVRQAFLEVPFSLNLDEDLLLVRGAKMGLGDCF
jgi:hypothetical protein